MEAAEEAMYSGFSMPTSRGSSSLRRKTQQGIREKRPLGELTKRSVGDSGSKSSDSLNAESCPLGKCHWSIRFLLYCILIVSAEGERGAADSSRNQLLPPPAPSVSHCWPWK